MGRCRKKKGLHGQIVGGRISTIFDSSIKSVYDVLPSPTNLHIWGRIETLNCQLCARKGSLQHILSNCPKALGDGRYRWHHDQVLKVIK